MGFYLSIQQPFAHGIVTGQKLCENRSWTTHYRGWLWIHAGKSRSSIGKSLPHNWARDVDGDPYLPNLPSWDELTYGAVIGGVELIGVLDGYAMNAKYYPSAHHQGPFCFEFANPKVLKKPIPLVANLRIRPINLEPHPSMFVQEKIHGR